MRCLCRLTALILAAVLIAGSIPAAVAQQPKLAALTFDDGPGPYTERLLEGLAERKVTATFFCLGMQAEKYPELIRQMLAQGHQVANHSYNHPNLDALPVKEALEQLARTDEILNEITGGRENYYVRPPYGDARVALREKMTVPVMIWSVDTLDWQLRNAQKVKERLLAQTFDGSIILMHDIHKTTVDGFLAALDTLLEYGYEFVTVKELLRRRSVTPMGGTQYNQCEPNGTDPGPLSKPKISVHGPAQAMEVTLSVADGSTVYYTTDGSDITYESSLYTEPFIVQLPCTIRAVAAWDLNGGRGEEVSETYTLPPAGKAKVLLENGKVTFEASDDSETVYVLQGPGNVYLEGKPWEEVSLLRDRWFSYYACGEGRMPTKAKKLLYTAQGNLLADVQQTDWYYSAIDYCLTEGYYRSGKSFKMNPNTAVTRGMLAETLYRHAGEPKVTGKKRFKDISNDAYYADAVQWGYGEKLWRGVGGKTFDANRPVSRQELAEVLTAYLGLTIPEKVKKYADHDEIASWARDSVAAVSAVGLMKGSSKRFRPMDPVTRAQLASVLQRMDEMQ